VDLEAIVKTKLEPVYHYYRLLLLRRSITSIKTQDKKSNKTQDNKNTSQYKVNDPN